MYDADGKMVWSAELDAYGDVRELTGERTDCPFRYQGQYEDRETGLYYNRFRYYSAEEGMYISQDPIGILGGAMLYNYIGNSNIWIDPLGLAAKVGEQSPSSSEVVPLGRVPSNKELQTKANDTHKILNEKTQDYKTTAAGYAVDKDGNGYIIFPCGDKLPKD